MITDAIFGLFRTILSWLAALLPSWASLDLAGPVNDAFAAIGPYLGWVPWVNHYAPLEEGLALLITLGTLWVASHLYHAVVWALSKLHLLGGGST